MMHVLLSWEQNRNKKLDLIHFLFVYSKFGHYHKNICQLLVDCLEVLERNYIVVLNVNIYVCICQIFCDFLIA